MTLLLTYLFLALTISFLCSIMEAVLLSTPISYLTAKAEKGSRGAQVMLAQKQAVDRPLSAILTLNTVAHTVGAAGVGAQATHVFGEAYFGVVSAVLTLLILVFTEILPKTIGARFSKELMSLVARMIQVSIIITYPLVMSFSFLAKLIKKNDSEQSTSREEIATLTKIGTEEGVFGEKENQIIQNLIQLKHVKVSEIMTPRVVVAMANEAMPLEEFLASRELLKYSRIPIHAGKDDHVTGYVIRQMVFERLALGHQGLTLKDLARPVIFVPSTKPVFGMWEVLIEKKEHLAVVIDEYGGFDGIVTMEDIIETLLGFEIVDEKDTVANMQQFARERWKKTKQNALATETPRSK